MKENLGVYKMKYNIFIFSTRFYYGKNWWCLLNILLFITPIKITLESQVIDKKPKNNPIQGRCY